MKVAIYQNAGQIHVARFNKPNRSVTKPETSTLTQMVLSLTALLLQQYTPHVESKTK